MDVIGKVLVACIGAILLVMSGVSVTMGNTDETAANQYLESVSKVVLESNYNTDVIEACKEEAADNGYTLEVVVYGSSTPGKAQYANVTLTYTYSLKLFGYETTKTVGKIL